MTLARRAGTAAVALLAGTASLCAQSNSQDEKQHVQQQEEKKGRPDAQKGRPDRAVPRNQGDEQRQPPRREPMPQSRKQEPQQQQRPQQSRQPVQPHPQRPEQQARAWQQQRGWASQGSWQGNVTWERSRAQRWQTDHRSWTQRGGYGGAYIPQARFTQSFGSSHSFRLRGQPVMYQGYPRFEYSGFNFLVVDPWPEYWSDNWYDYDDVYIDYDDGYYLVNPHYQQVRLAITIVM